MVLLIEHVLLKTLTPHIVTFGWTHCCQKACWCVQSMTSAQSHPGAPANGCGCPEWKPKGIGHRWIQKCCQWAVVAGPAGHFTWAYLKPNRKTLAFWKSEIGTQNQLPFDTLGPSPADPGAHHSCAVRHRHCR